MIKALLSGNSISSKSEQAFALFDKSSIGEKIKNEIKYTFLEALYLTEKSKMEVHSKNIISFDSLLKKAKKHDKKIELKLVVYTNLKDQGYVVKPALKFGTDFMLYEKGAKPGKNHSAWLVHPVKATESQNWYDFAAKNRIATTTNKKILLAIVDENTVSYYQVSWFKP